MRTLRELGEWGLLAAIAQRLPPPPPGWTGIGDDAAVVPGVGGTQVITTTDLLVEHVHFRRTTTDPASLGHKALAVNLSDLAAMGATPGWAVVGLALPGDLDVAWVLSFYDGLGDLARQTQTAVLGGDTVGTAGPIVISVTVVGHADAPLRRTTGRPGDVLFTTGPGGRAAAGLWVMESGLDFGPDGEAVKRAHRRPLPLIGTGAAIAATGLRCALLDDSDGLARSARLLAAASGCDVVLDAAAIPLDGPTRRVAAQAGADPLTWALHGGEDYNLVGACAPGDLAALEALAGTLVAIGRLREGPGRAWLATAGREEALGAGPEHDHFKK